MAARTPLGKVLERGYGGSRVDLGVLMAEIQSRAGSGRKAAKLVGVGETTWRRWRAGNTTPRPENLGRVKNAVRAVRAAERPLSTLIQLKTKDVHDGRERKISGRQLGLTDADIERVETAYVTQGPDAAAQVFVAAIEDDFYHDYLEDLLTEGYEPDDESYGGTVSSATW
jgi:hypothetical protein